MTSEKSRRYHSGECNLRKTAALKFTGIFRADFHPGLLLTTLVPYYIMYHLISRLGILSLIFVLAD